jgi:hypothetical protein
MCSFARRPSSPFEINRIAQDGKVDANPDGVRAPLCRNCGDDSPTRSRVHSETLCMYICLCFNAHAGPENVGSSAEILWFRSNPPVRSKSFSRRRDFRPPSESKLTHEFEPVNKYEHTVSMKLMLPSSRIPIRDTSDSQGRGRKASGRRASPIQGSPGRSMRGQGPRFRETKTGFAGSPPRSDRDSRPSRGARQGKARRRRGNP